jgi:uncharacterized protein (DUF1778 family)
MTSPGIRIQLYVSKDALDRIDKAAQASKESRSEFMVRGALALTSRSRQRSSVVIRKVIRQLEQLL